MQLFHERVAGKEAFKYTRQTKDVVGSLEVTVSRLHDFKEI